MPMGRRAREAFGELHQLFNCTLLRVTVSSIGSEMSGGVKNSRLPLCLRRHGTRHPDQVTRGRGGVIEDVRISNLVMSNIREKRFY